MAKAETIEVLVTGNAAVMRSALLIVLDDARKPCKMDRDAIAKVCKDALAAPPRNCDVGTADEQAERFEAECHRHEHCTPCPVHKEWGEFKYGKPKSCQMIWSQMPFAPAEGGAE